MRKTILFITLLFIACYVNAQTAFDKAKQAWEDEDYATAETLVKPLAVKGDVKSILLYGRILDAQDRFQEAIGWFKKGAAKNDAKCMGYLANCYSNGYGVTKNEETALTWYQKAANLGEPTALYMIGYSYDNGYGNQQINKDKAIYWYKKAAEKDEKWPKNAAKINMALIYNERGQKAEAKRLLEEAMKNGEKEIAPRLIAKLFYDDDPYRAVAFYRIAAENGDATSQRKMGDYFTEGKAVNTDYVEAAKWYQRAADQGDWEAQSNLGSAYEKVYRKTLDERDLKKSLKYYYLAQQDNHVIYLGNVDKSDPDNLVADGEDPTKRFYLEGVLGADKYSTYEQWRDAVVVPLSKESDVDVNIPSGYGNNPKTYALIIANENYEYEQFVPYAENDGNIFAKYCRQTLGIPQKNVHVCLNASLNRMKREVDWLKSTASVKNAQKVIVYYSGHGVPAEDLSTSYLLPVDGYAKNPSTGFNLNDLYSELGQLNTETIVFLDACFSGTNRQGQMLAESRGVAMKPKQSQPKGKMVVISACQGSETAYPYEDQKHGLFTYYLLKELQQSKGQAKLGDLFSFVKQNVSNESIKINDKSQTPSVDVSGDENWRQSSVH